MDKLPEARRAEIEHEFGWLIELSRPSALRLLTRAAGGAPPESIPYGPPLALWFLLHRKGLCRDVILGLSVMTDGDWRVARVPADLAVRLPKVTRTALADALRAYFRSRDGTGRYCAVDWYRVGAAQCFVARLSGRPRLLNGFTESGRRSVRPARPAFKVAFVFEPGEGRLLLRVRPGRRDLAVDLLAAFGQAVLGVRLDSACLAPSFRLDLLKGRFEAPPDAADMEAVRIKSVRLSYPERSARRRINLETLAGDRPGAIRELLRRHGGGADVLGGLDVLSAELEIRLRAAEGSRFHVIRIWRDGCSLGSGPLADRFRACLRNWGLMHAE